MIKCKKLTKTKNCFEYSTFKDLAGNTAHGKVLTVAGNGDYIIFDNEAPDITLLEIHTYDYASPIYNI